ncbi:hypothethical protein [Ralstonia solanacearum PSI07]|nr:hypothethical protein [Ralstonia solanacearum PSI07]
MDRLESARGRSVKLLDEASKLPPIYPRWMSEVDSADRFNPFREIIADRRLR